MNGFPHPMTWPAERGKLILWLWCPSIKWPLMPGQRADVILALAPALAEKLKEAGATSLYREVEMPLLFTLAAMEKKGVLVDTLLLKQMSEELGQLLSLSEEKIYRLAGEKFNINSPKQLQTILFEKLKLSER